MFGLLIGFALGAMAFTETGRDVGNKMWDVGSSYVKKAVDHVQPQPTKQPSGTAGDDSYTD